MSANIVLLGQWNYCVFSPNPLCNHLLHPSIVSPPLDSSPLAPQQSLMSLLLYLSEPHTTPHSYSLPLCECYKKTWLKGKILWLGLPAPAPPTHTFLLAQQNTHTKSLKGLNYYRHAHILEHTQTKAHTKSLSNGNRLEMMRSPERPKTSRQHLCPRTCHNTLTHTFSA